MPFFVALLTEGAEDPNKIPTEVFCEILDMLEQLLRSMGPMMKIGYAEI